MSLPFYTRNPHVCEYVKIQARVPYWRCTICGFVVHDHCHEPEDFDHSANNEGGNV